MLNNIVHFVLDWFSIHSSFQNNLLFSINLLNSKNNNNKSILELNITNKSSVDISFNNWNNGT